MLMTKETAVETSPPPTPDATRGQTDTTRALHVSWAVLATVVLVGAIAPLATDMYVPAFPQVGRELAASATQVQLTLTTFFVGMALGQLVGGPVSDAADAVRRCSSRSSSSPSRR